MIGCFGWAWACLCVCTFNISIAHRHQTHDKCIRYETTPKQQHQQPSERNIRIAADLFETIALKRAIVIFWAYCATIVLYFRKASSWTLELQRIKIEIWDVCCWFFFSIRSTWFSFYIWDEIRKIFLKKLGKSNRFMRITLEKTKTTNVFRANALLCTMWYFDILFTIYNFRFSSIQFVRSIFPLQRQFLYLEWHCDYTLNSRP